MVKKVNESLQKTLQGKNFWMSKRPFTLSKKPEGKV